MACGIITGTSNRDRLRYSLNLFSLQQTRMRREPNIYATLLIKLTEDISATVAIPRSSNLFNFKFLADVFDCLGDNWIRHAGRILGKEFGHVEAGVIAWRRGRFEEIGHDSDVTLLGKSVGQSATG